MQQGSRRPEVTREDNAADHHSIIEPIRRIGSYWARHGVEWTMPRAPLKLSGVSIPCAPLHPVTGKRPAPTRHPSPWCRPGILPNTDCQRDRDPCRTTPQLRWRRTHRENLGKLLEERDVGLDPPIHMSDALPVNNPKSDFDVLVANCLTHARRNFVDIENTFPDECHHLIEQLRIVYLSPPSNRNCLTTRGSHGTSIGVVQSWPSWRRGSTTCSKTRKGDERYEASAPAMIGMLKYCT